jgi:serine/threonine protein kinase
MTPPRSPAHWTYQLSDIPDESGAQGAIYFGSRDDGLAVAVKVPNPGTVEAIRREIGMVQRLAAEDVQGVVACLDVIEVDGVIAMVMPRYPSHLGQWLSRVMAKPDAGSLDQILARMANLARILASIHAVDGGAIVHRDVKPENVFIDQRGRLHLGDFGGAMAVEGLEAVELALFGTPMWAPLDQLLPGTTIPDPTWDTYATAVMLYAALTGNRPAYQADPRELLSPAGRQLWALARQAIDASGPQHTQIKRQFLTGRVGTTASDLIDLTGRSALIPADREVLDEGIERLAVLADIPETHRRLLQRGVWRLLCRALSPASHPSPPNRYRDAAELAEQLEDLRELISQVGTPAPAPRLDLLLRGPADGPHVPLEPTEDAPKRVGSTVSLWPFALMALLIAIGTAGAGWMLRDRIFLPWPGSATVAVGTIDLDRTEVTAGQWRSCAADGSCVELDLPTRSKLPATGVSLLQARAYCGWAGGRLPTEAEWLEAAGPAEFPWGDELPTCAHAVAKGCADDVVPVGTRLRGRSPAGMDDLAGNAWEWVEDGVLLGGSVASHAPLIGAKARFVPDDSPLPLHVGLRCAYDRNPIE